MKKNKLVKFIGIFETIVFSLLLLVGLVALAMALFQKFEVKAVLGFINDKLWFVEELNLYVINFFNYIFYSLELENIAFVSKYLMDYLHIIYTGLFTFFALLGFIFAISTTRAGSGKAKGKGGVIGGAIILFILAAAFTAFAVYYFIYAESIEQILTPRALDVFDDDGFVYEPMINKVIVYAIPGTFLFFTILQFVSIFVGKTDGVSKEKEQKVSNKDMGAYKPKMKPADGGLDLKQNQTAEYMKYQDSKSENPYINGNAKLSEDDLFGDLKPKPKEEEKKEDKPINPYKPATPTPVNNPFANSFNRPTPQPINTFNQTNNYGFNNPPAQNQFNTFNRPMAFGQPAQQPQPAPAPAPTNINLTINPVAAAPNATPQTIQVVQTPAATIKAVGAETEPKETKTTTPKTAPKSADEAFKAKPKAPTQAVARPKAPDMNLTEKLKELSALRQSGAISDDEYKALKQKAFQKFLKS